VTDADRQIALVLFQAAQSNGMSLSPMWQKAVAVGEHEELSQIHASSVRELNEAKQSGMESTTSSKGHSSGVSALALAANDSPAQTDKPSSIETDDEQDADDSNSNSNDDEDDVEICNPLSNECIQRIIDKASGHFVSHFHEICADDTATVRTLNGAVGRFTPLTQPHPFCTGMQKVIPDTLGE